MTVRSATPALASCVDRRLRLMQFVTEFSWGGTERQFVNLGVSLDPSRFRVEYGCLRAEGELLAELEARALRVTQFPARALWGARALRQQLRLAAYLIRARVDVIHTYNFHSNVFALPAAWLARVPVIVAAIRDCGVHLTPSQRRVQRHACWFADRVLVNAVAIKESLVADGYDPANIEVIPNGVDLRRFTNVQPCGIRAELGIPHDAPIVALVSRLNPMKGIDDFLTAAAMIRQDDDRTHFLIVGEAQDMHGKFSASTSYRERLSARIAALGLSGRLHVTGYRADLPAVLSEVTVSCLPSYSEGLSNVLLESMAAGLPMVATDVGDARHIVDHGRTGLLVRPGDPASIADALRRVLSDPAAAARMGADGRAVVHERFSLDRMVEHTASTYLSLSSQPRARRRQPTGVSRRQSHRRSARLAANAATFDM